MSITAKQAQLAELLQEFAHTFLSTGQGEERAARYANVRQAARWNYQHILALHHQTDSLINSTPTDDALPGNYLSSSSLTDEVLLKLLPYANTESNRTRGVWVHPVPAIQGDIRRWYEASGWVQAGDWPDVADALFDFVQQCVEKPTTLATAAQTFTALPYTKGFQAGTLSPILNALRPQDFALFNNRNRAALNYFTGTTFSASLLDYTVANSLLFTFAEGCKATLSTKTHPEIQSGFASTDLLDLFCSWLVEVKEFAFRTPRYWALALGDELWSWNEWCEGNFVAIGWDDLGDLSGIRKREFERRRDSLVAQYPAWTKRSVNQVWRFVRQLQEGDRVAVFYGTEVLAGSGTVAGSYYFISNTTQGHRHPVEWDDLTPRQITQSPLQMQGIHTTLRALSEADFSTLLQATATELQAVYPQSGSQTPMLPFARFLAPIVETLQTLGGVGRAAVVIEQVAGRLAIGAEELGDVAAGGANRIRGQIQRTRQYLTQAGLLTSQTRGLWQLTDAGRNASLTPERVNQLISDVDYARNVAATLVDESPQIRQLLESGPEYTATSKAVVDLPAATGEAVNEPMQEAVGEPTVAETVDALQPYYSLEECAQATGVAIETLSRWGRAIERKGQAIFYGPPGTGKTYMAQQFARHLVGGGDGFWAVVQFHPAYAYEDFVQGIRPKAGADGLLSYPVVPGRFLTFCAQAEKRNGRCVLIIDEINRANLARVFGELMYLLEYREESVALAADNRPLRIPANVRILGTMNTADRSLALVDHALRRRFAFLPLYPDYTILRRFHSRTQSDFPVEALISVLQQLNQAIGERDYAVGISYFLRESLADELADIWQMEIEPYLEEYFFDQPERVAEFRWGRIKSAFDSVDY